ncbi:dipeptidyl aminopeptidase/acylaminoacyl peptidase [Arcticibacter tournemirensis]|nr:dipeptidyl aminopeptidase/acylaminoacyl peptidase [Arcticibacter tournemirensis]
MNGGLIGEMFMERKFKTYMLMIVLFLMASCSREKHARIIPVEDFFRNPYKNSFQISPDGKYISFLQSYKNRMNVFVQSVKGDSIVRVSNESCFNISFYFWANNNEIVYMKDSGKGRNPELFAVNRNGRDFRQLLTEQNVRLKFINQNNVINNEILIALNKRDSTVFDAYRLNIKTGDLKIAERNPGNIIRWFSDENGKLRLALSGDGVNETLLYRSAESETFNPVITSNFKTRITPVGFCSGNTSCIYALSNLNRDRSALVEIDCSQGKETKTIFSHDSVDISEAGYSSLQRKLLYAGFETWKGQRYYLDDSTRNIYNYLEKLLPNTEVRITGQDKAEENFIVRTFTDKSPGTFYLYKRPTRELVKLSDINPALPASQMCSMKPVSFKSSDNLTINGYLTLPLGYKAERLPVVVIPHGGPAARDSWGFNSEVQFLANRGYAVLQVNFRGSKGYGKEFWIAGFKKWGSAIQSDITAGVRWLIGEGIADEKRIAIYGSGFGGFSALYGLCFESSLYKCGVSESGFVNLFTYIKAVPPYFKPMLQMYYEMVGNPEEEIDYFRSISPVFHTDKIKAPLLIAQNVKDPRVNVNETNQFVKELKNRKVQIKYLVGDSNSNNSENQMEFYRELELFLNDHLKK